MRELKEFWKGCTHVMMPHTPIGCLITTDLMFGIGCGMTSPVSLTASSANHSMKLAEYAISPFESVIGFPFSSVQICARSLALSVISLKSFIMVSCRCLALVLLHVLKAVAAASIACFVSLTPSSGT